MKKIPVKQEQIEKGFQKIKGASFEAFEEEFENVSQQLLKVIEESKQRKDLTSEQKEQLYEELEEIQQNISNLLQNRKQDIQISLRNMLEYQKNTDIGAQIISEKISIFTPVVQKWLKILSSFKEKELPRDDRVILVEFSSNIRKHLPTKFEKFLHTLKIFDIFIRKPDNSKFRNMYSIRKYAKKRAKC